MQHATHKLALAAVLSVTTILSANALTMQGAVDAAVNNHPDVEMAQRNQTAIQALVRRAKAPFRPTVDLTAGTGWEHSNNTTSRNRAARTNGVNGHRDMWRNESRLQVRQMLYDGFGTRANVAQQKHRETSANFNVVETQEIVALAALQAYLDVLRTRELVALGKANLETHKRYLNQVERRVQGGRGSQADLQQVSGRAALAEANLIAFQGELRTAEADYLEMVGEMPQSLSRSQAPFMALPSNLELAIDQAMSNNPAIHSAQYDIKAAQAAIEEAKSVFCPRFDIEAGHSRNVNLDGVDGTNNDTSVMLMMRYNLYNGGGDTAQVQERIERHAEAIASLEQTRRLVEENMMNAWSALQTSRLRLNPLTSHVESSQKTRNAYQQQFDLGQRTLLDLLDSEIELFNSTSALINGKYEVDLAVYEVLAHKGELVQTVNGSQVLASK